jgi:hypothetical protein
MTGSFGLGVSPDSIVYVETARSLLKGDGFQARGSPMTHYPPTYPILLAIIGLVGNHDILMTSYWLNALLFISISLLIGFTTYIVSEKDKWAFILSVLLITFSAPFLEIYSMAWSEAPFIIFTLLAIVFLSKYAENFYVLFLIAAAIFLGLASTVRYVGIVVIAPMALVLLNSNQTTKRRIRDLLLLSIVGIFPLCIWILRNYLAAGAASVRTLAFHPITLEHLHQLIHSILFYFWLPFEINLWLKICIALFFAISFYKLVHYYYRRRLESCHESYFSHILVIQALIFIPSYILFLLVSISFFDAHTPLNTRILSPVYVFIVILFVPFLINELKFRKNKLLRVSLIVFITFVVFINIVGGINTILDIRNNGRGYTGRVWVHSESMSFISTLPPGVRIYSNGWDAIGFISDKLSKPLPVKIDPGTLKKMIGSM